MTAINRRTVLKGMGVSLALPMMESLAPRAYAAGSSKAKRMAVVSVPFGMKVNVTLTHA